MNEGGMMVPKCKKKEIEDSHSKFKIYQQLFSEMFDISLILNHLRYRQ